MKRISACLAAWFALFLSVAAGAPARPLYVPPDPPRPAPVILLVETTWIGKLYTPNEQVTFHADGTLTYGAKIRGQGSPGTWKLSGNQLYFQINNWSEFHTVVQGDVISGPGTNKSGQKAQALLKRSYTDGAPLVVPR